MWLSLYMCRRGAYVYLIYIIGEELYQNDIYIKHYMNIMIYGGTYYNTAYCDMILQKVSQ